MSEGIDVREIKAEAMQMVAAGLRGQHSNNKVIRLCQEIERISRERDQAVLLLPALTNEVKELKAREAEYTQKRESGGCLPARQDAAVKAPAPDSVGAGADPFERAKLIRAGKLDNAMPDFEELTGWLQRVPMTWLPALLAASVHQCVIQDVFQPGRLLELVKNAEARASDPTSILRQRADSDTHPHTQVNQKA